MPEPPEATRPSDPPAVGRQIRRWRTERGLTLASVAERSGLNVGYLSQIENDKASPSLESPGRDRRRARRADRLVPHGEAPRRRGRPRGRPAGRSAARAGSASPRWTAASRATSRIVEATAPPGERIGAPRAPRRRASPRAARPVPR